MARKRDDSGRAPDGASSIYLGKDGYWHGRVTMGVRDDGRPDRRHVQGKTEANVIGKVRKLERARDEGRKIRTGKAWTLEKWLRHWLDNIAAPNVRYKTLTYYRTAIEKYLVPGIGAHRLHRLEPEHIEKLYARLRTEGASPSTVQQIHRTLRTALNEALRRERIAKNPAMVVKTPPKVEPEIEPLTVEEARRLLHVAQPRRNSARWAVALALGLRQGEALALKWSDFNEKNGTLTIRRALQRQTWQHGCGDAKACAKPHHKAKPCREGCKRHSRACPPPCPNGCLAHARHCPRRQGGGLVIVEPKSRAGRRVVNVPRPLTEALVSHHEEQDEEREHAGELWHEGGWMFAQPNGKPLDPRADYREWGELLKAAEVRPARLHDARHTAATMLLVLKVPPRAVMDLMGWSEASMTSRYQHVPDELRQGIARQMGGLLWDNDEDEGGEGTAGETVPA